MSHAECIGANDDDGLLEIDAPWILKTHWSIQVTVNVVDPRA